MDDISKFDPFAKDKPADNGAPSSEAPKQASPKQSAPAPAQPAMFNPMGSFKTSTTKVTKTSSAHCCVNGAYYTCGSGAAAAQCVGQPMKLMSCVQGCGFNSSCEPKCIKQHGPDPSACQRQPAKDRDCKRR